MVGGQGEGEGGERRERSFGRMSPLWKGGRKEGWKDERQNFSTLVLDTHTAVSNINLEEEKGSLVGSGWWWWGGERGGRGGGGGGGGGSAPFSLFVYYNRMEVWRFLLLLLQPPPMRLSLTIGPPQKKFGTLSSRSVKSWCCTSICARLGASSVLPSLLPLGP